LNIFDSSELVWKDILPVHSFFTDIHPNDETSIIWAVDMPGMMGKSSRLRAEWQPTGVRLSSPGCYYLAGGFGAAKILYLRDDYTREEEYIEIARFVSMASWHSAVDAPLCHPHKSYQPFELGRVVEKFFYSDQPLGLNCGHLVEFLAYILICRGFRCRKLLLRNSKNIGHTVLEVFSTQRDRWVLVDPDFGTMISMSGELCSGEDVVTNRHRPELRVLDIGNKTFTLERYNLGHCCAGQITWRPEFMSDRACARDPYYRGIIERGFEELEYYDLEIETRPVGEAAKKVLTDRPINAQLLLGESDMNRLHPKEFALKQTEIGPRRVLPDPSGPVKRKEALLEKNWLSSIGLAPRRKAVSPIQGDETSGLSEGRTRLWAPFRRPDGFSYRVQLPDWTAGLGNADELHTRSGVVVYEDGTALGPRVSLYDDVSELGRGRYLHCGRQLVFSSSDNTDPNRNGRVYSWGVGEQTPKQQT
jgi:hypothetical protein